MRANRYEAYAAWSQDSRAVIEIQNDRWNTYALNIYAIAGDSAATIDLRAVIEPSVRARVPAKNRDSLSFRVFGDRPVKLDAQGRGSLKAMLYVPKEVTSRGYAVAFVVTRKSGKLSASVLQIRRVKSEE